MRMRLIFLSSATLAALDAFLIMLSCLLGASARTIVVSAVVALIFVGIAVLLLGIDRHLARAVRAASESRTAGVTTALLSLRRYLAMAGAAVGLLMLSILMMILHRMSEGYAIFG
jgi:hypothetical protein